MKSHFNPLSRIFATYRLRAVRLSAWQRSVWVGGCVALTAITLPSSVAAVAAPADEAERVAQALPTPLPPLPVNSAPTVTGEQYLVLVNGNSDLLLQQVRQIEPGAFVNYVGGRSLIQAGRFNSYRNAQERADQLANFGIGADIQATDFAGAPIAVTPPSDYDLAFAVPPAVATGTSQAIPTSSVAATPAAIEFGQAAPFPSAPPATAIPSAAPTAPQPNAVAPPTSNATPPPLTSPVVNNVSLPSGYYVVIPANTLELQSLGDRLVGLGVPNSLVQPRTAPRGPHVAVGPYNDHGLAQEWSNYLRDSGVPGARVHFE